jgi:hypothetical protein
MKTKQKFTLVDLLINKPIETFDTRHLAIKRINSEQTGIFRIDEIFIREDEKGNVLVSEAKLDEMKSEQIVEEVKSNLKKL